MRRGQRYGMMLRVLVCTLGGIVLLAQRNDRNNRPAVPRPAAVTGASFGVNNNIASLERGCRDGGIHHRNRIDPEYVSVEEADGPVVAEGVVRKSFVSHEEAPWSHNSHDQNFDVKLDPAYEFLNSDANRIVTRENRLERWMEMEWEVAAFPPGFWPIAGDRVWMMGRWNFDCGHPPYETEIHPPFAVAFTRLQPMILAGDFGPSLTQQTSLYIHGRGGYYNAENDVSTPMRLLRDYEFDITLPPRPSPQAELRAELVDLPFGGPAPVLLPVPAENRVHVLVPLTPPGTRDVLAFNWDDVPGKDNAKIFDLVQRFLGNLRLQATKIEKLSDNRTVRVTLSAPGIAQPPSYLWIAMDNAQSSAVITSRVGSVRYFLDVKKEDGKLKVYDVVPQPTNPSGFRYGAVLATGWREPVLTQGFRVLRVVFDSLLVNTGHEFAIVPGRIGDLPTVAEVPELPANWRCWVQANGKWAEVPKELLAGVHRGSVVSLGNSSLVAVVPEDGALPIQTTGWVSRAIDGNFGVREPPSILSGLWDYATGQLDSNQPTGYIDASLRANANFGVGRQELSSRGDTVPDAPLSLGDDFRLRLHVDELARFRPGASTAPKELNVSFLAVRAVGDGSGPTPGAFDFVVEGQHHLFPPRGTINVPFSTPLPLPAGLSFLVSRGFFDTLHVTTRVTTNDQDFYAGMTCGRYPCRPEPPESIARVYDRTTNFGQGVHVERTKDVEVTYRIDCPNCEPPPPPPPHQILTVTFQKVRIMDTVDATRTANVSLHLSVDGQLHRFPLQGVRNLPLNTAIDLPPDTGFTLAPSIRDPLTMSITLSDESKERITTPPGACGLRPCPPVRNDPPRLSRTFTADTSFGMGTHTEVSTADNGETFELTYRIDVRTDCPNCAQPNRPIQ